MSKSRILLIVIAVLSLAGLIASVMLRTDEPAEISERTEEVFVKALSRVDSILNANEKNPEKYNKFKEDASKLSVRELIEESMRCVGTNNKYGKEEYYYRALFDRYSKDMAAKEKVYVVMILNNLGCLYLDANKLIEAYTMFKAGYEMAKVFDSTLETHPAFITNLGSIFKQFGDNQTAGKMYTQAYDIAYSPKFRPEGHLQDASGKIHTRIEYLLYMWSIDKLDSVLNNTDFLRRPIPTSTYEYGPVAKYLDKAADAYVKKEYYVTEALLDSAARTLRGLYNVQFCGCTYLMMADAMFHAKDFAGMRRHLDDAEKVISENNLLCLLPDLYKGNEAYYRNTGDTIMARRVHSESLAMCDSLFGFDKYVAIRDAQSAWEKTWTEVKSKHFPQRSLWTLLSSLILLISLLCLGVTFFIHRKEHKPAVKSASGSDAEPGESPLPSGEAPSEDINETDEGEEPNSLEEEQDAGEEEQDAEEEEADAEEEEAESDESIKLLFDDICKHMEEDPEIYDVDFSINTLARKMGVNSRRISRAVNLCSGSNFSSFVATYRVREACRILDEAATPLERPTTDVLAQMVGYKSRAHLTRVFKAVTGLAPADYISRNSK